MPSIEPAVIITAAEESDLARLEAIIARGLDTFYAVGDALMIIRQERLYRATHATFDAYCRERWNMSRQRAAQLIGAAESAAVLSTSVDISGVTEYQLRPIAMLASAQQPIAFERAQQIAADRGESLSHRHTSQAATELRNAWVPDAYNVFSDPLAEEADSMRQKPRMNPGMQSSDSAEWYTPAHIIQRVEQVLGHIDLDPCSNSATDPAVPALHHYTAADDGLSRSWFGKVYMNPPYGDVIGLWIERLLRAYQDGEITEGIALVPARTDTAWFQPLFDHHICFVRGRLKFSGAENSAPFPSAIIYVGVDLVLFTDSFGNLGRIK